MKRIYQLAAFAGLLLLASCFGQHNKAPNPGVEQDNTRIYGESRTAEPKQLKNKYAEDESGMVATRTQAIRDQFFPAGQVVKVDTTVAVLIQRPWRNPLLANKAFPYYGKGALRQQN